MRLVFGLVLVLGVGLAGFAVYMAQGFISQTQAERDLLLAQQQSAVALADVFVVKKSLKYGEPFGPNDVELIKVQADKLPEGTFSDIAVLFPNGAEKPRTVLRALETFEPVLLTKVSEPGKGAGITSELGSGMRAFAISVDVATGVSGFLRPGDRVDVYWSGSAQGQDLTKLIEAGVRIIAIDQTADADRSNAAAIARTVTVEVTPQEVAALTQAQSTGRLSLSLVGANDDTVAEAIQVDQNRLLGIVEEKVVQVEEEVAKVCTVRTRKGAEYAETEIPCTN